MKASEIFSITSHPSVTSKSNPSWVQQLHKKLGALEQKYTLGWGIMGLGVVWGMAASRGKHLLFYHRHNTNSHLLNSGGGEQAMTWWFAFSSYKCHTKAAASLQETGDGVIAGQAL